MPLQIRLFFSLACTIFLVSGTIAQPGEKFQKEFITLKRVIERNHFSPRPVDDKFSMQLFDHFLERLDEEKLYFTASDINEISVYRSQLDDELNGKGWMFFDKFLKLYKTALLRADTVINKTLLKPFDMNGNDNISFNPDSIRYAANDKQYADNWYRSLKYQVISQLAEIMNDEGIDKKAALQKEAEARKKIRLVQLRSIRKVLENPNGYSNYVASVFCDVLANSFDPHTEYMPLEEKQSFDTHLGTEGMYFGFSLQENEKGDLEIDRLMPGSPAWRSGDLNKGDVLLKLAWEGKEALDLSGADQEEVSELLNSPGNTRIQLTVRKANGMEKTASLTKEKSRNEDNTVKAFVLKGDKKIGYIYLPDFYVDLEGKFSSCANDVAKEIVKLKKENIEGLILDVRYNGGGSLKEALDMAGIFIEEGPLSMIKDQTGKIISLKDMNRGTIYDGPMTLLVNGQSASASEILGAVLQDYNRAVIVGCITYGKGTVQVVMPVDTINSASPPANPEYGFVKVTISKFYRVNGKTTQNTGVHPDIVLPDVFDGLNYHEWASSSALTADSIQKNAYYKPLPVLPIAGLAAKSQARINSNSGFSAIREYGNLLRDYDKNNAASIPLNWEKFIAQKERKEKQTENKQKLSRTATSRFTAANNLFDTDRIKADPFLSEVNNNWLVKLTQDIYIEETYAILADLINTPK